MPAVDGEPIEVRVSEVLEEAGGTAAVSTTFQRELRRIGVRKTVSSMLKINQHEGFDCPGCAWPEPEGSERKRLEFCENGAKAVAEEAMTRLIDDEFWAQHRRNASFKRIPARISAISLGRLEKPESPNATS
jgi:formate dehydrogenase major subunit